MMAAENVENESMVDSVSNSYRYVITPSTEKDYFMAKPIQFNIALKSSIFGDAGIESIIYNKSKGLATIITKNHLDEADINAGNIKIGNWTVKCHLVTAKTMCYGVIGPIDLEEDLIAIKDELILNGLPIVDLYRLNKKVSGQITATESVKIGFSVPELPARLHICSVPFRIRKFEQRPLQCFRCQRFGHIAVGCNSKIRCLYCSGFHAFKDCPKSLMKCSNCGEGHLANYGGCKVSKDAKLIESLIREENISYQEAKARMNSMTTGNQVTSSFGPFQVNEESINGSGLVNSGSRMYSEVTNGTNQGNSKNRLSKVLSPNMPSHQGSSAASTDHGIAYGVPTLIQDFVSCCNLFTMWQKSPNISDQFGRFMNHYNQSFGSSLTFKKIVDLFTDFNKAETENENQDKSGSSNIDPSVNVPIESVRKIDVRPKDKEDLVVKVPITNVSEASRKPKEKEAKKNLNSSIFNAAKGDGKDLGGQKGKRQLGSSPIKVSGGINVRPSSQTDISKSPKSKRQHHG